MATYCGHHNAPAEYALKEKEEEGRTKKKRGVTDYVYTQTLRQFT